VVSFVVAALAAPDVQLLGMFNRTQALHYLLALAVLLLGQVRLQPAPTAGKPAA
jgi:hypothetical protein